ncbi:MAG: hypothetical protein ACYS99_20765 [Planctomycetota bacterium]|jgi:hypothetical protein
MSAKLRLLLWLRFRTMFRGRGSGRKVAIVLAFVLLLPLAVWFGVMTSGLTRWLVEQGKPELLEEWVHLSLLFVYMTLVVMPVIGFAGSEFYDVTKLFHLPVPHRTVFVAQTLGHVLGSTVLFFLPALLGVVLALPGGIATMALRLVLLVLFLFHAVALGQLLQLVLLNFLRARRFRDLAIVLGAVLSGGFYVTFRLLAEAGDHRGRVLDALGRGISDYLIPVPSYWASSAIAPGAGVAQILVFVLGLLPLTALFVLLSASLQERAFHGEVRLVPEKAPAQRDRPLRPAPFPLSRIPAAARAMALQELRLLRREPAVKAALIHQFVFFGIPLLLAMWRGKSGILESPELILLWGVGAFLFAESFLSLNMLGLTGPAIAHLLATPVPRRRILGGKALAYLLLWWAANVGFVALLTIILAAIGSRFSARGILVVLVAALASVPVLLGVGSVFSVLTPTRIGARGRGALSHGQSQGGGCASAGLRMLALMIVFVLLIPVGVLCLASRGALVPLLSLPYALFLLWAGLRWGGRLLARREEGLVLELARSQD